MKLSRVGVDLAKNVYQLHGVDRHGKTVWKRRLRRGQWLQGADGQDRAGLRDRHGSVHRRASLGAGAAVSRLHGALIAPQFVKPYVKSNKNDANDAEAMFA